MTSIQDKTEDYNVSMPPLNCQDTKRLQLGAMCLVRATSDSAYKSLADKQ